jgi:peptidoglycan/xylan/chitin deacetylase (PgdA/CDA1 family)
MAHQLHQLHQLTSARGPLSWRHQPRMPDVLMYHSVAPCAEYPYQVTVSPGRFEQQMRWLGRRGLRGVSISELLAARRRYCDEGLVGLTFDDGYADFLRYALPVLHRYGFGAPRS